MPKQTIGSKALARCKEALAEADRTFAAQETARRRFDRFMAYARSKRGLAVLARHGVTVDDLEEFYRFEDWFSMPAGEMTNHACMRFMLRKIGYTWARRQRKAATRPALPTVMAV